MRRHHDHNHGDSHSSNQSTKNIWLAFALNFSFAIIELVGGLLTGSLAILADAVHDFGDSLSLGLALVLQKVSQKKRTETFSYGYGRFSLLSAFITGVVILTGSSLILIKSFPRIFQPATETPEGLGMLGLAVLGIIVNGTAALRLRRGATNNEKVLTWHFMEDLLGWVAVLIGAILILITDWYWIDPLLATLVAGFIIFNVLRHLFSTSKLFLQSIPADFDSIGLKNKILKFEGVTDVHDIHAWSLDGERNVVSLHVVMNDHIKPGRDEQNLKLKIQKLLDANGKFHTTIDLERESFKCDEDCETP